MAVGNNHIRNRDVSPWLRQNQHGRLEAAADDKSVYGLAHLIRTTEEALLKLFEEGRLSGTMHTCIGQEVCQLAFVRALQFADDAVLSNHRNHGHFLAYCGKVEELIAEIMGKQSGICRGRGGSQHIAFRHFHSNGIQGGLTPIAVGIAWALSRKNSDGIVSVFIGDGTLGEGVLYESMNLAAVWNVPLLIVVENNQIAQTTNIRDALGGNIEARGKAFGLATWELNDRAHDFITKAEEVVTAVRSSRKPGFCVVTTARIGPHSKGDDFRPDEEKKYISANDPLLLIGGRLHVDERRKIEEQNRVFVQQAADAAAAGVDAHFDGDPLALFAPVHAPIFLEKSSPHVDTRITFLHSINDSLRRLLAQHAEVVLLGEDLHDPYGGAFKATKGLSEMFPERVISTPISEAAITGAAIGMAMAGYKPIVEIMFADFLSLCFDQLYNHAVKFPWVYDGCAVPLVLRTPSGGHRGYGPTHSQSPEHLFLSMPGLTVVYPSHRHDAGQLLAHAVLNWPYPVLFFEHKLLYREEQSQGEYVLIDAGSDTAAGLFPTLVKNGGDADITFVTYGGSLLIVEEVAMFFEAEEFSVEIVAPSLLSPMVNPVLVNHLLGRTMIVIVEEAPAPFSWGAELAAQLYEAGFSGNLQRIGATPCPIPAARSLEKHILPTAQSIIQSVKQNL